ncbi:MAG: bifunctional UDP-N-acetylglucosamine diphosphorylase/glucosamine-1-phosphate N-acetyltransferase GlmU [Parvularculaceae bacterium]
MTSSNQREIAVIVLAAGKGTRMRSPRPKVLHEIGGRALIGHVFASAETLRPTRRIVVVGPEGEAVAEAAHAIAGDCRVAKQDPALGTGHAVQCALPEFDGFNGVAVILYADTPLIRPETLEKLAAALSGGADVAVLGFDSDAPGAYGRLVTDESGLAAIVEAKEATAEQLEISFCNSGVMAVRADLLRALLPKLSNANAKGEYYLTDLVALARESGARCMAIAGVEEEFIGVNSQAELAAAEAIFQRRARRAALEAGVTLSAPETVHFCYDTEIAPGAIVHPYVVFGPGVSIAGGAEVKSFSHIEGARIAPGAVVGPHARLRPGADIGAGARIGNFVEVKKARVAEGAKINHLSYVGDADVGPGANIGAGVITCNYDGFGKYKTVIGGGAFIGSNSALIAPVSIGAGAIVGAGGAISKDVDADALALTRAPQTQQEGWAARFRAAKTKKPE